MKTLFIIGSLNIGGIENYIAQLSKVFNTQEERPIVLLLAYKYDISLFDCVKKHADIITLKVLTNNVILPNKAVYNLLFGFNKFKVNRVMEGVTDIVATNSFSLVVADKVSKILNDVPYVVGVYHGQEFIWESNSYSRRIEMELFRNCLSDGRVHIYGEGLCSKLLDFYSLGRNNIQTFPLGMDLMNINQHYGDYTSRRVVCLGRLADFKAYNEQIIRNFGHLLEKDPKLVCDIYGFGPEEKRLKELVLELRLTKVIRFKGKLNVDEIPAALKGAFVVIGSGLTTIQAASLGIPSVVCLDSNPSFTSPGFFSEVLTADYNELSSYSDGELYSIVDIVERLLVKDFLYYRVLCDNHVIRTENLHVKRNYVEFRNILCKTKTMHSGFNTLYYAWSFLLNRKSKAFENRFVSDVIRN